MTKRKAENVIADQKVKKKKTDNAVGNRRLRENSSKKKGKKTKTEDIRKPVTLQSLLNEKLKKVKETRLKKLKEKTMDSIAKDMLSNETSVVVKYEHADSKTGETVSDYTVKVNVVNSHSHEVIEVKSHGKNTEKKRKQSKHKLKEEKTINIDMDCPEELIKDIGMEQEKTNSELNVEQETMKKSKKKKKKDKCKINEEYEVQKVAEQTGKDTEIDLEKSLVEEKKREKQNHKKNDNVLIESEALEESKHTENKKDGDTEKASRKEKKQEKHKQKKRDSDMTESEIQEVSKQAENSKDEIDPEIVALKEKKREKRKQKKLEKERQKIEHTEKAGTAKVAAVDYLRQWQNDRDTWKFQKVRQVWLLQNMYDQTLVNEDSFEILLAYLEGLKGQARERTVKEAENILNKVETEEDNPESEVKSLRAKQIIQLLSDE